MMFLNWTRVAILYEDEYGLIRLQELVRSPPAKNVEIYIRQTGPDNYRSGPEQAYRVSLKYCHKVLSKHRFHLHIALNFGVLVT